MSENGTLPNGMWNYCPSCRVQWHTREFINECDVCGTFDILHSEFNKIEGE